MGEAGGAPIHPMFETWVREWMDAQEPIIGFWRGLLGRN